MIRIYLFLMIANVSDAKIKENHIVYMMLQSFKQCQRAHNWEMKCLGAHTLHTCSNTQRFISHATTKKRGWDAHVWHRCLFQW